MSSAADVQRLRRQALGAAIRRRRVGLGLSQDDLAERMGIERKSVSRAETGAFSPSVDRLWMFSDALHTSAAELLIDGDE